MMRTIGTTQGSRSSPGVARASKSAPERLRPWGAHGERKKAALENSSAGVQEATPARFIRWQGLTPQNSCAPAAVRLGGTRFLRLLVEDAVPGKDGPGEAGEGTSSRISQSAVSVPQARHVITAAVCMEAECGLMTHGPRRTSKTVGNSGPVCVSVAHIESRDTDGPG